MQRQRTSLLDQGKSDNNNDNDNTAPAGSTNTSARNQTDTSAEKLPPSLRRMPRLSLDSESERGRRSRNKNNGNSPKGERRGMVRAVSNIFRRSSKTGSNPVSPTKQSKGSICQDMYNDMSEILQAPTSPRPQAPPLHPGNRILHAPVTPVKQQQQQASPRPDYVYGGRMPRTPSMTNSVVSEDCRTTYTMPEGPTYNRGTQNSYPPRHQPTNRQRNRYNDSPVAPEEDCHSVSGYLPEPLRSNAPSPTPYHNNRHPHHERRGSYQSQHCRSTRPPPVRSLPPRHSLNSSQGVQGNFPGMTQRIPPPPVSTVERRTGPPSTKYESPLSSLKKDVDEEEEPATPEPEPQGEIELVPGYYVPLRGSKETMRAIASGNIVGATCFACEQHLHCVDDAEYILCPDCRVIGPLAACDTKKVAFGVGLGFKREQLQDWKYQCVSNV